MNHKKTGIIVILCVIIVLIIGITYYFTKEDENNLTVTESQWIANNKNQLIDFSIPSNTPVISNNGEGIVFDFLSALESDTGLEFNKLSYEQSDEPNSTYAVLVTDKVEKDEILIYQDNYVLVTKTKTKYNELSDIQNIIIGVLEDNMTAVSKYLDGTEDVAYKSYKNNEEMIKDMKADKLDAVVIPRLSCLDEIISDEDLNIAYNINEYKINYVIRLGDTKNLNRILTKYYNKWKTNFENSFNTSLINTYFDESETDEKMQVKFRSKRYSYGFVLNSPFDVTTKDGLKGFNHTVLNNFAQTVGIEIDYKKYSSISSLLDDFQANKIDIIFNYHSKTKYNMDVYQTVSVYNQKIVIASPENIFTVNNVSSLKNKTVLTIKNSKIEKYLKSKSVKTKSYDNVKDLVNNIGKKDIIAIDSYTYDYYVRGKLSEINILNTLDFDQQYGFVSRDVSTNETFNELFDFYLSFEDTNQMALDSYNELLEYNQNNKNLRTLLIASCTILFVLIGLLIGKFVKYCKGHNKKLSKADKLRYIDTMTSLKNRYYLNENIPVWDNSEIYPQTIIVIDLNNIAYINDNFGHAEGDKVIIEGAGILIANQLSDSDIIRTNGNEFLIFTVGHDEKAIISYIRKLHREFKNITHGFGAAVGYSMITDEIKTIDDAINEATADMRNNKENK